MKLKIVVKMLLTQGRICRVTSQDAFHLVTAAVGACVFQDLLANSRQLYQCQCSSM